VLMELVYHARALVYFPTPGSVICGAAADGASVVASARRPPLDFLVATRNAALQGTAVPRLLLARPAH
jgi:hypothetical protein